MTPKLTINKNKLLLVLIIAAITLLAVNVFLIDKGLEKEPEEEEKPSQEICEELPSGVTPLAQGKQTYTILTDKPKNPQITEAAFDPLDVKVGESQTVIVKVLDAENNPITSENTVSATYYTDNGSSTILLSLRRADGPDLVTTWEGLWECEDSHNFIYQAVIKATNSAGESSVTLSFR